MRCYLLALVVGVTFAVTSLAEAGHPHQAYPKVRTFSGGYYGPTQAHYQYQRRYGRPWQGQGGFYGNRGVGFGYSSYRGFGRPAYGYQTYGYGAPYGFGSVGYSSFYGSTSFYRPGCGLFGVWAPPIVTYPLGVTLVQPSLELQTPGVYTPYLSNNPYVNDGLLNNGALWQQEVPDLITPQVETLSVEPLGKSTVLPPASTPQAQLRSLQQQQAGDARLKDLDYLQAYLRYKDAIDTAGDRVEPHYRMGIALAGMKRFDKAVRELKRATELDATWVNQTSLEDLLGHDNLIGKTQLKQRVADWTLADAHDADRLYLLGTLLHLDGDGDRAKILFDTAMALVGSEQHLTAFRGVPTPPAVVPQPPQPGLPQAPPQTPVPPAPQDAVSIPDGPVFPSKLN